MDRGKSRSVPHLPRYQSLSPARSPLMARRSFVPLRSVSQPSERIYYIDCVPTRVISSYPVRHSPSPNRAYKIHLYQPKTGRLLTRITKSLSVYDMNSSHLYTSQEDLFDRATTEAIKRRVGSCEDIYHKAPFFPDITPSESGVSFGESEEGFGFDGEDDNISQQSFESSSAFNEVTVDSEFDRCDSDNFSGTDYTGDKALAVHYEGNADDNGGKRKRGAPRSNYEHEEQESACTSPLTCGESRKREVISNSSWEFDKLQSRTQALRVLIPGSETSAKSVRESNRLDERRMSSTPLAQSTPHVSPGGTDEARLYITPSWSADGISEADSGYAEARKLKSARALFNVEGESKHSSRIEDSSCNSSCSEDNFSDVSNTTISSPVPRKTKLVKKHSDKHLSVKTNTVQNLPGSQTSGVVQRASCQHLKSTSRAVDSKGYDSIVSAEVGGGGYAGQRRQLPLSSFSVTSGEHVSGGKPGDEWWTVYSSKKITEHEANAEAGKFGKGDEAFGDEQDKRRPKPLSVNIPLISAGKRGQEKLRQLSQTSPPLSRSSDVSPAVSPRQASGKTEGQPVDQQSRANSEEHSFRPLDGLQRSDRSERYENCESEEEQHRKSESLHTARSLSAVSDITNENDMYSLNKGEVPHVSHKHFQWKSQTREDEENVQKFNLGETELTLAETQIEGAQSNSFEEIASGKYKPDSFPCPEMANVSETRSDVVNCTSVNSRQEVNVLHDNRPIGPKHRAEIDDELGSPEGILSESLRTLDTVSISAGLPGSWIQVSPPASVGDTAAHGASRGNYLDTEISGNTEEVFSEREVAVNASDESTDLQNYREQDEEHLLQKPDKANKECLVHPGESDVRLSLKSALSSHHSAGSLFTETSPVISGVCCDFTENKDGDTLFVEHTLSEGSTGPLTGNLAYGEDEQQKKHGPHLCSRNASTTDACHVQEGMGLSEGIDSHIEVTSSIQSLIRPEITVDLIATGGRIESMRNSSQGLDYVPSLHGQVEVTEDLTSSLLVSSELIKTVESEQVDVSTAVRANSGGKNIQGDLSKGADNINADYLAASGSDKVSDIFNSDIGMPFTVESIQTSSHIAERGGPGMHKQEYFRTERGRGFVERSEEFMFCPSLQDSAVMVVRQIASKCAEHSRRATEEVAASDLIAGHTALGLSCDASSVKSVTEKYTTGAFNAKKDDSYLIITAKNSCVSDESAVSSDGGSLEVSSYSRCSPCSSTSADVACVIVQGNDVPQSGAPAHISPSSQLVTATRLAGHARAEAESCTMKDKSGISDPNIAVDLACSSFRDGCDVSRHCELMASNTRTFTTVTQGANTLDNLQTQLSLISGDPACSRWNASGEVDLYRDHAEATSMLKEIVRGDSSDFVHSSDTSSEHSHMLSEYSVSDVNSNLQAAPREHYDNDYDYVTTSFPKGVKFSPRPHHHHHLQLLKHGHLKVSSLWTLQEETEGVTDSVSPKASPKRSHLSSAWEERTTDNLLPSQQASPTVGKHSSVTKKEDSDQFLNSAREQITPESESSGCDDSDGNYSSVSTSESTSCRSSSLEREQTLLSETDSLAVHLDKSDSLNTEDPSGKSDGPNREVKGGNKCSPVKSSVVLTETEKLTAADYGVFIDDGIEVEVEEKVPRMNLRDWDPNPVLSELYEVKLMDEVVEDISHQFITMEGLMEKLPMNKRKATLLKTWKRRFFRAVEGWLYYYETGNRDQPSESIQLMGGIIHDLGSRVLGIDDGRGRYLMVRCPTEMEYGQWKVALESQTADNTKATYVRPVLRSQRHSTKNVVVIDLGSSAIRAGILGQQASLPQLFFLSLVAVDRDSGAVVAVGKDALRPDIRHRCKIIQPIRPSNKVDQFNIEVHLMRAVFEKIFTGLNSNPADFWVMLSTPQSLGDNLKKSLMEILVDTLKVKGVCMVQQALLSLYSYNATSGIIVDIGHRIEILPIFDGFVIEGGVARCPYGAQKVQESLTVSLLSDNYKFHSTTEQLLVRYAMEKSCYVAMDYAQEVDWCNSQPHSLKTHVNFKKFALPDGAYTGVECDLGRFKSPEGFFNVDMWEMDYPTLHKLIYQAIQTCPMDNRRHVWRAIFLSGGVTLLPGFAERLEKELSKLAPPGVPVEVHAAPQRYHAAYIGGCSVAMMPQFEGMAISKEEWKKDGARSFRKWQAPTT